MSTPYGNIPPEPKLSALSIRYQKKAYMHSNIVCTNRTPLKSTPCSVWIPQGHSWILDILQPLTRITTLRRSSFTERGDLLEAWIGGSMSGRHCCRSSMLTDIAGARTRTFFKLTNRWRSDRYSVRFWGVFGLKNASKWSGSSTKTIAVDVSFLLISYAQGWQLGFGRYAVFRKACFLPL